MEEVVFLALTIAVELPMALLCMTQDRRWRAGLVVLSVNLISHPLAWHALTQGVSWESVELTVLVFEVIVFLLLFPTQRARAVLAAALMNILSAALGLLF